MLHSDRDKTVTSSGPSCKGAVAFIDWLVLALEEGGCGTLSNSGMKVQKATCFGKTSRVAQEGITGSLILISLQSVDFASRFGIGAKNKVAWITTLRRPGTRTRQALPVAWYWKKIGYSVHGTATYPLGWAGSSGGWL